MASRECGGLEIPGKRWRNRPVQHGVIHFAVHIKRGVDLTQRFSDKVPMVDGLWGGGVISLLNDLHHFLVGKAGVEKVALRVRRKESELQGLTAQPQGHGKILRLNSLVTDVNNSVIDAVGDAGEEHAFETPVWEKQKFFIFFCRVWQHVSIDPAQQIRADLAEFTAEKMVCLFQGSRRPALRALELDK
jgi:hypothetical protein